MSTPWPGPPSVELDRCRAGSAREIEFVYIHGLTESWCGVADESLGESLMIHYPRKVFPYCWLFMDYGGWRGHHVVVLEPCTNYPKSLQEAANTGRSAILGAAEEVQFKVELALDDE